jgi:hypothetical protein
MHTESEDLPAGKDLRKKPVPFLLTISGDEACD